MPEKEIDEKKNTESDEVRTPPINTRPLRIAEIWYTRVFFFVLFSVFAVSLIIPLRPTYSENEKRELTKFPKFTLSAFASGDYFDGISEWYSDTFPFREQLADINAFFSALYGKTDIRIQGDVTEGDEIPDLPTAESDGNESKTESSETESEAGTDENVKSEESSSSPPPASSAQSSSQAENTQQAQTLGALLIYGDTAYEYYNFVRSTADLYVSAVNRAAALLDGKTRVYDMIVPTSMGITAPESILSGVKTSDQRAATEYMYSAMNGSGVNTVSIYDTLKAHREEYIYFRTDHHWTALGAYYAYTEFINATGGTPATLDSFILHEFPGYLGSFYTSSKKLPQLAANPDTVYAYQPSMTNTAEIHFADGSVKEQPIISDMSAVSSKYLTFIKGDRPLTVMRNPELSDGSVCVVVKESFGNAFVPFLVPNYQTVYVVDYRYFSGIDGRGLVQLCADTGARDLLFINNISATRNKTLVEAINALVR